MGIEVKKVRSDNETYICSTENGISLNPKEAQKKAHYPYHSSQRRYIDIMHILKSSNRKLAESYVFLCLHLMCLLLRSISANV